MPNQLTAWDQVYSTEDTNEILTELALVHLDEVLSKADREWIRGHVCRGDYNYLCHLDLDYERLSNPLDVYAIRQVLAFFQKRADLDLGINKRAVAFAKFEESEEICRLTNRTFELWEQGRYQFRPYVEQVLHLAQRKISSMLGSAPKLADLKIRFGPGATTEVKRKNANARVKLNAGWQCSEELVPFLPYILQETPVWVDALSVPRNADLQCITRDSGTSSCGFYELTDEQLMSDKFEDIRDNYEEGLETSRGIELVEEPPVYVDVKIVDAKLVFVPKSAKTDRSIGVEPSVNSMFQLGIGSYMAERLAAGGVDLRDQSKNQRLARHGSLTGALATLDLSSASDTVATGLVAHLLPPEWFDLLAMFRTGVMSYEGKRIHLEKFSSMGNGYTFPLESLIFWALASSVVELSSKTDYFVSVYGDDIIIPSECFTALASVLNDVGFVVNRSKSFSTGPFRESCGKDYFNGIDIRPCYIKGPLSGESLFVLHNYYVRTWQPDLAAIVLSYIHPVLRKFGPDGYGDGHLLGDWTRVPHGRNCGWGGYVFETFTWKPKRVFKTTLPGDRVLPTYSIYSSPPQGGKEIWVPDDLRLSDPEFWGPMRDSNTVSRYCYDRRGRLGTTVPGSVGYKLLRIYTLTK
ncbi:TPA_asm: RNA-directed RNA polymerase [ssRNA phage SRR7976299_10]|uniref:RNA-directed RNA polymerase n=1 Tax=ssRNA phage SRR7976299_10 TaxID=2786632 RepID=A0A8S5L516_9VIRU|nr:RNA-directed RNA polymerase [ssRNA phage SRR7976299_10]DAD52643.1 TPA_asm: RNA-directed RNA polymerase [ssRNA phage SRR7976299_10]